MPSAARLAFTEILFLHSVITYPTNV